MSDPTEESLEALRPNLSPEEACLSALLDLSEFQQTGPGKAVNDFYASFKGEPAPDDLRTRISAHAVEQTPMPPPHFTPQKSYVEGFEIAATVVVNFDASEAGLREMLNIDFVKTNRGLIVMQRKLFPYGEGVEAYYNRAITQEELVALTRDAIATKDLVVEEDAELMKLGPLVEEQAEDGSRRFHIGDILSITTGRLVSPRGVDGIYDILGFITSDSPFTTQLGRFAEECKPFLQQQTGAAIEPYSEVPEEVTDRLSLYKWLNAVNQMMDNDSFLRVTKNSEDSHAVIDVVTELALDTGLDDDMKTIIIEHGGPDQDDE